MKSVAFLAAFVTLVGVEASPAFLTGNAANRLVAGLELKASEMRRRVLDAPSDHAQATGLTYYVSAAGDDTNDGRSPATAIKTLVAVNALSLKPHDAVLFRRGDLFRGTIEARQGVLYSAYGEGEKPTICASRRDYADPTIWELSPVSNVWLCSERIWNAGIITFDHDPQAIGEMDVKVGFLRCNWTKRPSPAHLEDELDFWCDLSKSQLYLKCSSGNPGRVFKRIEIGCRGDAVAVRGDGVRIDNLHVTLTGSHGIGAGTVRNLEVSNCVLDWLGGAFLIPEGQPNGPCQYGNAVEVYGGCDGYCVRNCWIYQIYDTGITHQFHHDSNRDITQENVEYASNLIERCFWSIEYYNTDNRHAVTRNVLVRDNFCRYGGWGWGSRGRERDAPMLAFGDKADVTENYVNEGNVLQYSRGTLISNWGRHASPPGFILRRNVYVQFPGGLFARIDDRHPREVVFDENAPNVVRELYGEEDGKFVLVEGSWK